MPSTDRAPRCRKLTPYRNPCGGLELSDTGLCARHLAEAHRDYLRLTGGKLTIARGTDAPILERTAR